MGNLLCRNSPQNDYKNSFFTQTSEILETTDLTAHQKILFRRRYLNKLYSLRGFKHAYAIWFYIHKFLATTLGVGIPALLSIQYYFNVSSVGNPIYWTAWGLSILGGLVTGYNNIFKVDQRYFLLRNIYQKLKNEGWTYIVLSKKYDKNNENNEKLMHNCLFVIFMESVEDILGDYMKHDMETVMQDNKEADVTLIQARTLGMLNASQKPPDGVSLPNDSNIPPLSDDSPAPPLPNLTQVISA